MRGREFQSCLYPYKSTILTTDDSPKRFSRTPSKEDLSPRYLFYSGNFLLLVYSNKLYFRPFASLADGGPFGGSCQIHGPIPPIPQPTPDELQDSGDGEQIKSPVLRNPAFSHSRCPPEIHKSCFCVRFIAEHTKMLEDSTKVRFLFRTLKKV